MSPRFRSPRLQVRALVAAGLLAVALSGLGCQGKAQPSGLTGSGAEGTAVRAGSELCGGPSEPCCSSPVPECAIGLRCAPDSGRCESTAAAAESTRLCATDADCPQSERCCPVGFAGSCEERSESPCPLPDLALSDNVEPSNFAIFTAEVSATCSIEEGCQCLVQRGYAVAGRRRLLQVQPLISNVGTADLVIGAPTSGRFDIDTCAQGLYLADFFRYELVDAQGNSVINRTGRLVLACNTEFDYARAPGFEPRFSCGFLGLRRGLFLGEYPLDSYGAAMSNTFGDTDCTTIDISDVAPGDYELRVTVNAERAFAESRYQNNVIRYPLQIPAFENPLQPCRADSLLFSSYPQECAWAATELSATSCTPGSRVRVGCVDCDNNYPQLRICDGPQPCSGLEELSPAQPLSIGDVLPCPEREFSCPTSGTFSVYVAPSSSSYGEGSTRVTPGEVNCAPRVLAPPEAGL